MATRQATGVGGAAGGGAGGAGDDEFSADMGGNRTGGPGTGFFSPGGAAVGSQGLAPPVTPANEAEAPAGAAVRCSTTARSPSCGSTTRAPTAGASGSASARSSRSCVPLGPYTRGSFTETPARSHAVFPAGTSTANARARPAATAAFTG